MSKYVICPQFVKFCFDENIGFYTNVLSYLSQKNKIKMIVDSNMNLFRVYESMINDTDSFRFFLNTLTYVSYISLEKVSADISETEPYQLSCIRLLQEVRQDKKLITRALSDYADYSSRLTSMQTLFFEPDSVEAEFQIVLNPTHETNVSIDEITQNLMTIASLLAERKSKKNLVEDLYNDLVCLSLRAHKYNVCDQTRSGASGSGQSVGELDILVRKSDNSTLTIIEGFRITSCGKNNTVIPSHLKKLLSKYDSLGLNRNFVVVYAEATKFRDLCKKYFNFISDLDKQKLDGFETLKVEEDNDLNNRYENIDVYKSIHKNSQYKTELYHFIINMK